MGLTWERILLAMLGKHIRKEAKNGRAGLQEARKLLYPNASSPQSIRQPEEWKKAFANQASYKRLIPQIYKGFKQCSSKKTNNLMKQLIKYTNMYMNGYLN